MQATDLLFILPFALIIAVMIGIGSKLVRITDRAKRDIAGLDSNELTGQLRSDQKRLRLLPQPGGRRRDSSIAGIAGALLRHTDGSYTKAYHVELNHTVFQPDHLLETRIDELARLLANTKPPDTVIQFRLSTTPDRGRAIQRHLRTKDQTNSDALANVLHTMGVCFYEDVARQNAFRSHALTVWVRVPVKHHNDESRRGLGTFFPTLKSEIRTQGKLRFIGALLTTLRQTTNSDALVARTVADEKHAIEEARRTLRQIEHQSPLKLKPFTREELWEAVYYGHRQDSDSAPVLPQIPGCDIRDYLCGETISGDGYFVMHGKTPAAIVSMFVPPQPSILADCMRVLSLNPELSFRHTIVTEYVYLDQDKARKRLDKRIRQVSRANRTGRHGSFEGRKAITQLSNVREEITGDTQALVKARFYAVIYAEPATNKAELHRSLQNLDQYCEQLITAIRRVPGAEASREEPAALRAVYHRALVGELDKSDTGREILETTDALAALTPTESAWPGSPRPHTLCSTPTGHLLGIDLFDRSLVTSPLCLLIAQPRGGKSVFMCRLITDVLATKANARVRAVDYGKSLEPLVEVLEGRYLRFDHQDETKTINTWDYPGLEQGIMPDDLQVSFVVADLMQLARAEDTVSENILTTLVREVYKNQVPRNRSGRQKVEPRLSNLLDLLRVMPYEHEIAKNNGEALWIALESFRNDPFIDAPTHPDFLVEDSRLDVYEIDSLGNLPERVRQSMAFRIAAHVMRSIGKQNSDGTRSPLLLAFDEMWEIVKHYPRILDVIERAARTGGKENAVTLLASHAYEDFTGTIETPNPVGISLAKTAGVKFIGKQAGEYSRLIKDSNLAPSAQACVHGIRNVAGEYAQFLGIFGTGQDQVCEMLQVDLSPTELWTFTTNPDERNARALVASMKPDWPMAITVGALATHYPRGLTAQGLTGIDESLFVGTETAAA